MSGPKRKSWLVHEKINAVRRVFREELFYYYPNGEKCYENVKRKYYANEEDVSAKALKGVVRSLASKVNELPKASECVKGFGFTESELEILSLLRKGDKQRKNCS